MKPSSHINFITCGYVVRFPDKEPLVGALSAPQFFAGNTKEKTKKKITSNIYLTVNVFHIDENGCP